MLVHDRPMVHRDDGFWSRWAVAQCTMRPLRVVMFPPLFDDNLRFFQGIKDLAIKQFISEAGIEALTVSVLPGRPWLDAGSFSAHSFDPVPHGLGYEPRSVVRSDESWHPA